MPAKSRAQFRLMKGIAEGSIKPKGGLSKATASEFVGGQSPKGLPEKKKKSKGKMPSAMREDGTRRRGW